MPKLTLRWRLALYFTGLTAATILLVALAINSSLDRQFSEYLMTLEKQRNTAVMQAVEDVFVQSGTWQAMANRWIQVRDAAGIVVFDSGVERRGMPMMHGRRIPPVPPEGTPILDVPLEVDGMVIGQVRLGSLVAEQGVFSPEDLVFRATVNRSIVSAGVIAVLLAGLFSLVLAQNLAKPLQILTKAARRMAAGQLEQRVIVAGSDEFGFLGQAFNEMAANLGQLEQLRRKAAADISHELRTPLTTIRGYVEGMRDGIIPITDDNWQAVEGDVQRLAQLVSDLQDLAQAEAPLWNKQPVVLQRSIEHAVETVQRMIVERDIEIIQEPSSEPIVIKGQEEKLERVWINLLANAAKYSPQGSAITVKVKGDIDTVTIRVEDQGPGIPLDQIPLIFERFYRIDSSRTRATGGSGIGLTIAKELVQGHGGTIGVDDEYLEGACFVVTLPRWRD